MTHPKYELNWCTLPIHTNWSQLTPNMQRYAHLRAEGYTITEARYILEWSQRYCWDIQRGIYERIRGGEK